MAQSKTETIRKGLLALGWTKVETRSSRECYCQLRKFKSRGTGEISEELMFVWLGTAGSLRWSKTSAFTKSRPVSDVFLQGVMEKGTPEARSNAMLNELGGQS